jgi:hypothetical protein
MDQLASSFHELEAGQAGAYATNRAFIRLQKRCAFWHPENVVSHENYAIFLHEYLHYLHNFSTGAGISDFLHEINVAQWFVTTVGADGTSAGMDALDEESRTKYHAMQRLRHILRGDYNLPIDARIHQRDVEIKYLGHSLTAQTISFPPTQNLTVDEVRLDLCVSSASAESTRHTVSFGTFMVMESAAFLLESLYLEKNAADLERHAKGVAPVPYKVARCVLEGIAGRKLPNEICMKACILALYSSEAGASFVHIANVLRDARTSPDEVVAEIAKQQSDEFKKRQAGPLADALREQLKGFADRPLFSPAMKRFDESISKYVAARTADPFFELKLIDFEQGSASLYEFFQAFPPCAVQVLDGESDEPDPLEYVGGQEIDSAIVDSLSGYYAMMDYALAHSAAGLAPTANARSRCCPYARSCSLPARKATPEICESQPWQTFDPTSKELCWYAAGVGASRGRRLSAGANSGGQPA